MKAATLALAVILEGVSPVVASDVSALPLLIVPGAEQVVVHGSKGVGSSVEFEVREPYPALHTIGFLVDTLAQRGWKIAMPGAFGPPRPTPGQRPIAEAHRAIHEWEGRWRNAAGQEISYKLVYECPLEQHGMHAVILKAWGYWYDKKEADQREAKRQAEHAAFCADLRERNPEILHPACAK
jgi:hypothetical protein